MYQYNSRDLWENVWSSNVSEIKFWQWVERDLSSIRTRKIEDYVREYHGGIKGFNIIEIGSGMGEYSFIFGKKGAKVTLLDNNKKALDRAKVIFERKRIKAKFLLKDIFNSNKELKTKFDIAMSFGTIEHFKYPKRCDIIKKHYDFLKTGGILVIGVPNILFFPHEIMKMILHIRKKWYLGYEKPFSRMELRKVANNLNLKHWKIIGSSFSYDFKKYLEEYRNSSIGKKLFGQEQKEFMKIEKESIFDDFLGADIVLLGVK